MKKSNTKESFIAEAQNRFDEGYACSQSVLLAFADHFKLDKTTAKRISATFGGGMGRLRETCGAVTGGFMVMGLAFGNEEPKDMETKLNSCGCFINMLAAGTGCAHVFKRNLTGGDTN